MKKGDKKEVIYLFLILFIVLFLTIPFASANLLDDLKNFFKDILGSGLSGKVICTPNCTGKTCGSDGCGGSCGAVCLENWCDWTDVNKDGKVNSQDVTLVRNNYTGFSGSCNVTNRWCNWLDVNKDGKVNSQEVTLIRNHYTGFSGPCYGCLDSCIYQEKKCSGSYSQVCNDWNSDYCFELGNNIYCPNGCNNTNGECNSCTPNCIGKQCGDNGCGGSCGTCSGGYTCNFQIGQCFFCIPQCQGKECGDNGCGGVCGNCSGGATCNNQTGQCVDFNPPNINLISPVDNAILANRISFICNTSDDDIMNITLYHNININKTFGPVFSIRNTLYYIGGKWIFYPTYYNSLSYNITNPPLGNYTWNCFTYDRYGNSAFGINRTIFITTDSDSDGCFDSLDRIIGNESDVKMNYGFNLTIYIDNQSINSGCFYGVHEMFFYINSQQVLSFVHNFSKSIFYLNKTKIDFDYKSVNVNLGDQLLPGETKTVYLYFNLSEYLGLCLKDAPINSIYDISENCNETNEIKLDNCLNTISYTAGNITCLNDNGNLKIIKLNDISANSFGIKGKRNCCSDGVCGIRLCSHFYGDPSHPPGKFIVEKCDGRDYGFAHINWAEIGCSYCDYNTGECKFKKNEDNIFGFNCPVPWDMSGGVCIQGKCVPRYIVVDEYGGHAGYYDLYNFIPQQPYLGQCPEDYKCPVSGVCQDDRTGVRQCFPICNDDAKDCKKSEIYTKEKLCTGFRCSNNCRENQICSEGTCYDCGTNNDCNENQVCWPSFRYGNSCIDIPENLCRGSNLQCKPGYSCNSFPFDSLYTIILGKGIGQCIIGNPTNNKACINNADCFPFYGEICLEGRCKFLIDVQCKEESQPQKPNCDSKQCLELSDDNTNCVSKCLKGETCMLNEGAAEGFCMPEICSSYGCQIRDIDGKCIDSLPPGYVCDKGIPRSKCNGCEVLDKSGSCIEVCSLVGKVCKKNTYWQTYDKGVSCQYPEQGKVLISKTLWQSKNSDYPSFLTKTIGCTPQCLDKPECSSDGCGGFCWCGYGLNYRCDGNNWIAETGGCKEGKCINAMRILDDCTSYGKDFVCDNSDWILSYYDYPPKNIYINPRIWGSYYDYNIGWVPGYCRYKPVIVNNCEFEKVIERIFRGECGKDFMCLLGEECNEENVCVSECSPSECKKSECSLDINGNKIYNCLTICSQNQKCNNGNCFDCLSNDDCENSEEICFKNKCIKPCLDDLQCNINNEFCDLNYNELIGKCEPCDNNCPEISNEELEFPCDYLNCETAGIFGECIPANLDEGECHKNENAPAGIFLQNCGSCEFFNGERCVSLCEDEEICDNGACRKCNNCEKFVYDEDGEGICLNNCKDWEYCDKDSLSCKRYPWFIEFKYVSKFPDTMDISGKLCIDLNKYKELCVPNCTGKTDCSDDGCGGKCGCADKNSCFGDYIILEKGSCNNGNCEYLESLKYIEEDCSEDNDCMTCVDETIDPLGRTIPASCQIKEECKEVCYID